MEYASVGADLGSDRPGEDSLYRVFFDARSGRAEAHPPWRIGMLRGYGNAINAEAAIAFLRAAQETDAVRGGGNGR